MNKQETDKLIDNLMGGSLSIIRLKAPDKKEAARIIGRAFYWAKQSSRIIKTSNKFGEVVIWTVDQQTAETASMVEGLLKELGSVGAARWLAKSEGSSVEITSEKQAIDYLVMSALKKMMANGR